MLEIILATANVVLGITLFACISWIKKMSDSLNRVNTEIATVKTDVEWIKNSMEAS